MFIAYLVFAYTLNFFLTAYYCRILGVPYSQIDAELVFLILFIWAVSFISWLPLAVALLGFKAHWVLKVLVRPFFFMTPENAK